MGVASSLSPDMRGELVPTLWAFHCPRVAQVSQSPFMSST